MPLNVTPGSASADSYAALTFADTYHLNMGNTTWTGTDALKENALRRATAWVDGRYRAKWPGYRGNGRSQALGWPRYDVIDWEAQTVPFTSIPIEVQKATAEAALRELVSPGSLTPDYVATDRVTQESVGSISVTYADIGGADAMRPMLIAVDEILAPLIGASGATTLLARA